MIVKIYDYGHSGEGVGKNQGKVCFVPFALKDEEVQGEITSQTSKFCKVSLEKVIKKSSLRIDPPCPYFGKCGGCAFQNLKYSDEIDVKLYMLSCQLKKVGFDGKIEVVLSPNEYGYRNKIKLFCHGNDLALNKIGSQELVSIKKCLIVNEFINQAIEHVQTFISAKNIGKSLDNVYIRSQGQNIIVWFKFKRKVNVDYRGLQIMLGAKAGIYSSIGKSELQHISGVQFLSTKEFDLDCKFLPNAFHQVNNEIGEKLYSEVLSNILGNKVINAYSGAGVLSGIIAKNGKTVYGIELGIAEHESAERLKEENKLGKLFNIKGDCALVLPNLISSDLNTLVVDPPRAGLDKSVCQAINSSNIKRLIYISCDSATLVRDIERLNNYVIKSVKLFDMFPKTSSMETLCILERDKKL